MFCAGNHRPHQHGEQADARRPEVRPRRVPPGVALHYVSDHHRPAEHLRRHVRRRSVQHGPLWCRHVRARTQFQPERRRRVRRSPLPTVELHSCRNAPKMTTPCPSGHNLGTARGWRTRSSSGKTRRRRPACARPARSRRSSAAAAGPGRSQRTARRCNNNDNRAQTSGVSQESRALRNLGGLWTCFPLSSTHEVV